MNKFQDTCLTIRDNASTHIVWLFQFWEFGRPYLRVMLNGRSGMILKWNDQTKLMDTYILESDFDQSFAESLTDRINGEFFSAQEIWAEMDVPAPDRYRERSSIKETAPQQKRKPVFL